MQLELVTALQKRFVLDTRQSKEMYKNKKKDQLTKKHRSENPREDRRLHF